MRPIVADKQIFREGVYRLRLTRQHTSRRVDQQGIYPVVEIMFHVPEGEAHFHIPLLLSRTATPRTEEAEMSSAIREWLNLSVRWFHVFAGIMWVGQTYYFTWLDGQFTKLEKKSRFERHRFKSLDGSQRGFYTVEKQESLSVAPEQVRWFRWEALMTWVAGVILLVLVYYLGDGLIDPDVADISKQRALRLVLHHDRRWIIYDLAVRSPLAKSQNAFAGFALAMTAVAAWGLTHALSGRAAYIHVGAIFAPS